MSASAAPALARKENCAVALRLSDPAFALACLSPIFGLLLTFFPISLPRIIVQNWWNGRLTPTLMVFAVLFELAIYLRVAHLRSAKPGIMAAACLGFAPVVILVGLNLWLQATISRTLYGDALNASARVEEEILIQTYFALMTSIFVPFLLIIFAQQFQQKRS